MDWTEAEARLATLEREVTRHQRLAREQQALTRDDGRMAAVTHGPAVARGYRCRVAPSQACWRRVDVPGSSTRPTSSWSIRPPVSTAF